MKKDCFEIPLPGGAKMVVSESLRSAVEFGERAPDILLLALRVGVRTPTNPAGVEQWELEAAIRIVEEARRCAPIIRSRMSPKSTPAHCCQRQPSCPPGCHPCPHDAWMDEVLEVAKALLDPLDPLSQGEHTL